MPVGITQTGTLLASYPAGAFNSSGSGILNFSFAGSSALSGGGVLVYLQFKVSKTSSGNSTIYPVNITFNESMRGDSASGIFRTINLATLNITPSTANLIDGDTLRFTAAGGTSPYRWSSSDSTVASINSGGLLTALKGGAVTVQAVDSYGGNGVSGTVQIYDTRVSISDTAALAGDTVDVPIFISPVASAMHVQSFQAKITFDSSVVHALGIIAAGTGTSGWSFTTNITGTRIVFAGASANDLGGPGVLCRIRFLIPAYVSLGRSSSLSIQQLLLNEGSPRAYSVNGKITVATLPNAPSVLNAVAFNYGRIDLTWHDNASNETGYTIQKTMDTSASWSTMATLSANATSDSSTGLTDGTKYYYRVFASNSGGHSGFSNISSAVTPMRPPTTLAATQPDGESINLTWHDNSGSELGYSIERKVGSSGVYTSIDSVEANVATFTDTTGTSGNQYFYRVRGYNLLVASAYSNEANLTLSTLPDAPTSLNATAVNYGRIDLGWHDNATNETGYTIQRTTDTAASWPSVMNLSANSTSNADSWLVDGTKYFYRVFASNSKGNSDFSNVSSAITPMQPPTKLAAGQIPGEKIKLTWQDNSGSELGYYVERKVSSTGTYAVTDSTNTNVTTFTDTTGMPGTVYFYRVRGYNRLVTSAYSDEINLTLTGIGSSHDGIPDKFELSQNYPNPFNPTTVIGYQIPVSTHMTLKIYDILGREVATLFTGRQSAGYYSATLDAGNLPSGVYFYRLQAGTFSETRRLLVLK